MRLFGVISVLSVAACAGQVASIGVKPMGAATSSSNFEAKDRRVAAAGPPLLGFVTGPNAAELHALFGQANKPQLGDEIAIPKATKNVFLPPRQAYALVESSSDEPLAIMPLRAVATGAAELSEIKIAGVMAHPDLVAFSPSGRRLVLYSQRSGGLQVVSNLPNQPSIRTGPALESLGVPSQIAISDDADVLIAGLPDGRLVISSGGSGWAGLTLGLTPTTWAFVPRTHDVVISDTSQNTIFLVSQIEQPARTLHILAQNVQGDRLALTRDGAQLIAAGVAGRQLWAVDLSSGAITSTRVVPKIDFLAPLRDGFTFLISASPEVTVLKLRNSLQANAPAIIQSGQTSSPIQ